MSRKIDRQRCYKAPKDKLNLFLTGLEFHSGQYYYYEAEWVFDCKSHYDVVVNGYGGLRPESFHKNLEKFIEDLNNA